MLLKELQKAIFNFSKILPTQIYSALHFQPVHAEGKTKTKQQTKPTLKTNQLQTSTRIQIIWIIKTITNCVNEQVIGPIYQHYICNLRHIHLIPAQNAPE